MTSSIARSRRWSVPSLGRRHHLPQNRVGRPTGRGQAVFSPDRGLSMADTCAPSSVSTRADGLGTAGPRGRSSFPLRSQPVLTVLAQLSVREPSRALPVAPAGTAACWVARCRRGRLARRAGRSGDSRAAGRPDPPLIPLRAAVFMPSRFGGGLYTGVLAGRVSALRRRRRLRDSWGSRGAPGTYWRAVRWFLVCAARHGPADRRSNFDSRAMRSVRAEHLGA